MLKWGWLVIFLVLCSSMRSQQQLDPHFKHLELNKYPNEKISLIIWDNRGTMWGTSNNTLFSDDGSQVRLFKPDRTFENENDLITEMVYDKKRDLIFMSFYLEEAIAVFDLKTETYEWFEMDSPYSEIFPKVTMVTFDYNQFFIPKWGGGFSIFNYEEKRFEHFYNHERQDSTKIPVNYIKSIIPYEDNKFLIGTFWENKQNPGLLIFSPSDNSFTPFSIEGYVKDEEEKFKTIVKKSLIIVHFLHKDVTGNIWVGSYSGFFHIDIKNKKIRRITGLDINKNVQNADNCLDYAIDDRGYFWISTPNNGLMIVNPSTYEVKYLKHHPKKKSGLISNFLSTIIEDPSGNIWVRDRYSNQYNIYNVYQSSFEIHPWGDMDLDFSNRSSQHIPVNQMNVMGDGNVIISSGNGLINYNSNTTQDSMIFQFENDGTFGYLDFPHFNYYRDKLYFFRNGYPMELDLEKLSLKKMEWPKSLYHQRMKPQPIFNHLGLVDGKVFFNHYGKVYGFDVSTHEFEFITKNIGGQLHTNKARVLASEKWLFRYKKESGICIYDYKNDSLVKYSVQDGALDSTYENAYVEGDSVWLCYNNGLQSFNEITKQFTNYNDVLGIDSTQVVFIIRDRSGLMWVGKESTILRWDQKNNEILEFDQKYGLNPFNLLPGVPQMDHFGNIYIASTNGIVKFNPDLIKGNDEKFKIHFSALVVNSDTSFFSLAHPFSKANSQYDWDQNSLVFNIGNNQLVPEKPHEFHYRLIGLENEWTNNGNSSSIRFPKLKHGKYRLEVKAINSYGLESNVIVFDFEIKKPFWMTWWFIVLMVMVLGGLVWLLVKARERKIRERNRQLEATVEERTREVVQKADKISEQKDIIEEKNKEIVDSINYAQRIQSAYLPPEETFHKIFKNGFVYFQPKDLVSGDFYWFYGQNNEKGEKEVFVAAADCTGHGVPGALMSVICCNAMNETVITRQIQDTGKILDTTRDIVKKSLKSSDNSQYKDGMDISLCKINLVTRKVEFSGANNPLWIITSAKEIQGATPRRYDDHPNILWEVKGDKQPIGLYEHEKPFTTHHLSLSEGDKIYMFSDGYQDQFGGEDISDSKKGGKKFKSANFKKLLVSLFEHPMGQQKEELHNTFVQWKGDLEQIDDVCVIGICI